MITKRLLKIFIPVYLFIILFIWFFSFSGAGSGDREYIISARDRASIDSVMRHIDSCAAKRVVKK